MKRFLRRCALFVVLLGGFTHAAERPSWMDEQGIIMAGSWEEPSFRARRAGYADFKMPAEWLPGYKREHSQAMIDSLKALGVTFIMTHGYKGYGFEIERQGMQDAVRFSRLIHDSGLSVGAYIGSTLGWETLFKEIPEARDWLWLDPKGEPGFYSPRQKHRYLAMKNHPGYKNYIKKAIRFAIEEMRVDLVHLDNTSQIGIGWDDESIRQFRAFLKKRNRPGWEKAKPPKEKFAPDSQLWRDWIEFRCEAIEQYYRELAEFVRSLNPQCAIDINPQGFSRRHLLRGIDHGRLLRHGQAYWDESYSAGWENGQAKTRIRSLKIGQAFDNSVFLYSETPLDVAEMMAFNVNCLGCVVWFEGGELLSGHVGRLGTFPRNILPYIRFFHRHHDFYRDVKSVADVAILFDFETVAFGSEAEMQQLFRTEKALQNWRVPYAIVFSQQESQFDQYQAIIAAPNCRFHSYGGHVLRTDDPQLESKIKALSRIQMDAPDGVVVELQRQTGPNRWLLHLVNYRPEGKVENVKVNLRIPAAVKRIRAFEPTQATAREVSFVRKRDEIRFALPKMNVYALVVME